MKFNSFFEYHETALSSIEKKDIFSYNDEEYLPLEAFTMFKSLFRNPSAHKEGRSFYSTLLLSFLAVAVISTLLLSIFLTVNYLKYATTSARNYNQQLLSQTNYAIDQMNENVDRLAVSLLSDERITAFLSLRDRNSTAPVLASQVLDRQLMVLPYIQSIYLYNAPMNIVYSSSDGFQLPFQDFQDQEVLSRLDDPLFLSSYDGSPIPGHSGSPHDPAEIFSYYLLDNYTKTEGGTNAIIINVYASGLTDSIRSMKDLIASTDTSFLLLDQNKNYLAGVLNADFTSAEELPDSVLTAISQKKDQGSSFVTINKTSYFQTSTQENDNGWYLLNFIPVRILFQEMIASTLIGSLILIGVFLFTCIICLYVSRRLNNPVETITQLLENKKKISCHSCHSEPREFRMILTALSSLQENNRQLRSLQKKSRYSLTQACLNDLICNHQKETPEYLLRELEQLDLIYLTQQKLCMAVIKIDNYRQFLNSHESDELWALRYSIANITEEITSSAFTCNVLSRENDKFVLLIACETDQSAGVFEEKAVEIFFSIQENIHNYLHLTVSIAYSTIFQGLENLSPVYKNMENSLLLKMRYGHQALIDPYQIDELESEGFHLSSRLTRQMADLMGEGQNREAWAVYEKLTQNLFLCDYNEISSVMIHLVYSTCQRLTEKFPMLKVSITAKLKSFLSGLEAAEISEDIQTLAKSLIDGICAGIQKLKSDPSQQNSAIVAQKVVGIVQRDFANPALCLCSIAEEIGLSSNYTGHIFKQAMHKSVAQYILELRMEKVAQYLQSTSLPLNKILDKVGLEKNNYFYTRFKKYFGMSLGEYRQQFHMDSTEDEQ